jgi:RNA polymerase sigma factor (TIGR02999 family)
MQPEPATRILLARLHSELSQIAAARLRRERDSSLSTNGLINDVVIRLVQLDQIPGSGREHLIALASRMMRSILIDHARSKASAKRSHVKVELCTRIEGDQRLDLVQLETALGRLKALDETLMQMVEMRYFGGMTIADIAVVTGLSESTVKRHWQVARAWLLDAMNNPLENDG